MIGRDLQLGDDLVDDGACAAGAFVIHAGNLLLAPAAGVFLEDDDLCVLPAEFDDRIHLGVKLLDGERDGVDLLHELCADQLGQAVAARTGDEDAGVAGSDAKLALHACGETPAAFPAGGSRDVDNRARQSGRCAGPTPPPLPW